MSDYEKLFFPFHYKWLSMTKELSNADFGFLVRALLNAFINEADEPDDLPKELVIPFRFIKDAAERVIEHKKKAGETGRRLAEKRWGEKSGASDGEKSGNASPSIYGKYNTFTKEEVRETFALALKRSYEKDDAKEN